MLSSIHIKLPCPQEPQQSQRIQPLLVPLLLECHPELVHRSILFLGSVARVTRLISRRGRREIEVGIVFGIELHVRGHVRGRYETIF